MTANRTIWIIAEGDTERAAAHHLKAFLDSHAGGLPKVRLRVIRQDGGLKERAVHGQAVTALGDDATVGVVALTDVFPGFPDAASAKTAVQGWLPEDPRCFAHVASHDFEACLLVGWDELLRQAGAAYRKPWGLHPEQVNTDNPPAHRIRDLFQHGKPPRRYKKPVDGKKLFEKLALEEVARRCPEFKAFLNRLLALAGYLLLP